MVVSYISFLGIMILSHIIMKVISSKIISSVAIRRPLKLLKDYKLLDLEDQFLDTEINKKRIKFGKVTLLIQMNLWLNIFWTRQFFLLTTSQLIVNLFTWLIVVLLIVRLQSIEETLNLRFTEVQHNITVLWNIRICFSIFTVTYIMEANMQSINFFYCRIE